MRVFARLSLLFTLFFFVPFVSTSYADEDTGDDNDALEAGFEYLFEAFPAYDMWLGVNLFENIDGQAGMVEFLSVPMVDDGWELSRSTLQNYELTIEQSELELFIGSLTGLRYLHRDYVLFDDIPEYFSEDGLDDPLHGLIVTAALGYTPNDGVLSVSIFFGETQKLSTGAIVTWAFVYVDADFENGVRMALNAEDVESIIEVLDDIVDGTPENPSQGVDSVA